MQVKNGAIFLTAPFLIVMCLFILQTTARILACPRQVDRHYSKGIISILPAANNANILMYIFLRVFQICNNHSADSYDCTNNN